MRLIDADTLLEQLPIHPDGGMRSIKDESIMIRVRQTVLDAPTVNGWISVKEKLPEEPGWYLVASDSLAGFHKLRHLAMFAKNMHEVDPYNFEGIDRPGWYEYDSEWGNFEHDNVTHWMPLPEPPEGDIGNE